MFICMYVWPCLKFYFWIVAVQPLNGEHMSLVIVQFFSPPILCAYESKTLRLFDKIILATLTK